MGAGGEGHTFPVDNKVTGCTIDEKIPCGTPTPCQSDRGGKLKPIGYRQGKFDRSGCGSCTFHRDQGVVVGVGGVQ